MSLADALRTARNLEHLDPTVQHDNEELQANANLGAVHADFSAHAAKTDELIALRKPGYTSTTQAQLDEVQSLQGQVAREFREVESGH